jgi:hypothetical protein
MMGNRYRDGMTLDWALLWNWGTLLLMQTTCVKKKKKIRWLKGKVISPEGIRRIPIQQTRGRSARSSEDALGNLRRAKGLT